MSFLGELQSRKKLLKPTIINVTYPDGSRTTIDGGIETKETIVDPSVYGFVVDTKPDTEPACIIDKFLYLGSQDSIDNANFKQFKLTHVLSIGIEMPEQKEAIENLAINCLDLPDTDLTQTFLISNAYIENVRITGGRVLVHCNAGVSRSSSVVIGYLIQIQKMKFNDAYKLVKSKRACCRPNDGFLKQLMQLK